MPSDRTALLDMQQADASSVIVHQVPEALAPKFLQWQRGITQTAGGFPGYLRTEVYPPSDGRPTQWVVVIHFDSDAQLHHWLDSPQRAGRLAELETDLSQFSTRTLPRGFGPWFADLDAVGAAPALPPDWKMALVVLLALYPTVMLLTLLVAPRLTGLGLAVSMLIGNALSVALLQWALMPKLTAALRQWLIPAERKSWRLDVAGTLAILAAIGGSAALFRWLVG